MGASPIMPSSHAEKEPPPPHTHEKNGMERKDCQHRKNTPIGETLPPPHMEFIYYSCSPNPPPPPPPHGERLYPPLSCADHNLHSLYSVCLRELEKKSTEIKQKQTFSGSFIQHFRGGGISIVSNTQNFIYR